METKKLLDVTEVAAQLGISVRNAWRMRDAGRLPKPVTLGRLVRWRASDIGAWIADGCPDVRRTGWTPSVEGCGCGGQGCGTKRVVK